MTVDWQKLSTMNFVYEHNCWQTCGGGFCCSSNHPDFDFRILPLDGTSILYMRREYEFLSEHGLTSEESPKRISLDFGGPAPLEVVYVTCSLLGRCEGVLTKPLICRMYPFIPRYSIDGSLTGLSRASIFDLTFDVLGAPSPCTLTSAEKYERLYQEPETRGALYHPEILLYLQAVEAFSKSYTGLLARSAALQGLKGKDFWRTWETEYLLGNLVDFVGLRQEVLKTYTSLTAQFGSFQY